MHKIALIALKEILLALLAKIPWYAISERLLQRLAVYALEKLKERSTNDVTDQTVQDVIDSLQGKRLKVIDDLATNNKSN